MKVKRESEVTQSCLTLCDPMDCSLPGSSIHGIFQARVLEWGAIAFSYYTTISLHILISDLGCKCFDKSGDNLEAECLLEEAGPMKVCLISIRFLSICHLGFTYVNKLPCSAPQFIQWQIMIELKITQHATVGCQWDPRRCLWKFLGEFMPLTQQNAASLSMF